MADTGGGSPELPREAPAAAPGPRRRGSGPARSGNARRGRKPCATNARRADVARSYGGAYSAMPQACWTALLFNTPPAPRRGCPGAASFTLLLPSFAPNPYVPTYPPTLYSPTPP